MMMRIQRVLPLAPILALGLGGCAEVKALFEGGPTAAEVQALTVKACSFAPTANTVGNIIAQGVPALRTAQAIADAICLAVAPKAGVEAGKPTVAGVPVEGVRVN